MTPSNEHSLYLLVSSFLFCFIHYELYIWTIFVHPVRLANIRDACGQPTASCHRFFFISRSTVEVMGDRALSHGSRDHEHAQS